MRVGDQNGLPTLGEGPVYQTLKNVLERPATFVETLLMVSVRTNARVRDARKPLDTILGPFRGGICTILHPDFR
jgi:hypothetical protein